MGGSGRRKRVSARHQVKRLDRILVKGSLFRKPVRQKNQVFFVRCGFLSSGISPALFAEVKSGPDVFADALVPPGTSSSHSRRGFSPGTFDFSNTLKKACSDPRRVGWRILPSGLWRLCLTIPQLSSPGIAVRRTASLPLAYDPATQYAAASQSITTASGILDHPLSQGMTPVISGRPLLHW